MLSVTNKPLMLSVIMLNVVAPTEQLENNFEQMQR
jgi:hypothetical protein